MKKRSYIANVDFATEKIIKRLGLRPLAKGEFRITAFHIGHGRIVSGSVWRIRANPKANELSFYANNKVWVWKVPWSMLKEGRV